MFYLSNISHILQFQHEIKIKNKRYFTFFFQTKSSKFTVHFTHKAYCQSDTPHFKCSSGYSMDDTILENTAAHHIIMFIYNFNNNKSNPHIIISKF